MPDVSFPAMGWQPMKSTSWRRTRDALHNGGLDAADVRHQAAGLEAGPVRREKIHDPLGVQAQKGHVRRGDGSRRVLRDQVAAPWARAKARVFSSRSTPMTV
jgi:hypothetical protein